MLQKAKTALENRFIKEVASKYLNNPEMAYLGYQTAKQIDAFNKSNQKTFSISDFREIRDWYAAKHEDINKQIDKKEHTDFFQYEGSENFNNLSQMQEKAEFSKNGLGIFDGILQGIEQAQQQMEQQHKRQEKNKTKQKQKYKQKNIGELDMT